MFSPWPTPMPTPCRSHSFFCHGLVFTQTKASTDGDSVPSSSQSVVSWVENIYYPYDVMAEPYGVSASCSSTRGLLTLTLCRLPCQAALQRRPSHRGLNSPGSKRPGSSTTRRPTLLVAEALSEHTHHIPISSRS